MSNALRLMGIGMPAEQAKRVGFFVRDPIVTYEAVSLQGPGNVAVAISSASASVVLGSSFDIGDEVLIHAKSVAVSLYPATSEIIWPTSAGAVHAVSADVARIFMKMTASVWVAISSV